MNKYNKYLNELTRIPRPYFVYPINVARNIARMGKRTKLFLSTDIENFPSNNYEKKVSMIGREILLKEKKKVVLVHRRFEVEKGIAIPKTKDELKKLLLLNKAEIFHEKIFKKGHFIEGLDEWLKVPENNNSTIKLLQLNYTNPYWEPQFVCDDRIPYHRENFPYRYRSNTHLLHIICHEEYKFIILNDVFTVHEGFKEKLSTNELMIYNNVMKTTKETINQFNFELQNKYPNMRNVCRRLDKM
uniref:Beta-1,4-glucuronyltransferase 1 n=1 Tax=Parastrongyloides trichosuri TaxID=131310 RepID=A0A0N5A791_PARTI